MGKKGMFKHINLQKEVLSELDEYVKPVKKQEISGKGKPYTRYHVVSDKPGIEGKKEIGKIALKLKRLGIGFNGNVKDPLFVWKNDFETHADAIYNALNQINQELEGEEGQTGDPAALQTELQGMIEDVKAAKINPKTKSELEISLQKVVQEIGDATNEGRVQQLMNKIFDFSKKFHNYTAENLLYIYAQDPNATQVAGPNRWRDDFKRKVIDPRKTITINCGNNYYNLPNGKEVEYTPAQQRKDDEYMYKVQKRVMRANPNEIKDIEYRRSSKKRLELHPCVVYDVANTTGQALPDKDAGKIDFMNASDDNETANKLFAIAKNSLESEGISVTQDPATASERGWSRGGHINVSSNITGTEALSVIIAEWASDLLHHETGKFYQASEKYFREKGGDDLTPQHIEQIKRVQAQAVGATLCDHYGLPTYFHPTRMALLNAQGGLDSEEIIKENMTTISGVALHILRVIEADSDEFNSEPEQQQQQ